MTSSERYHVGIIGAGITGLDLCRRLTDRGVSAVVFEAEPEPGGAIRSRTALDRIVEEGPQRTRLTPVVRELVRALALEPEMLIAPANLPLFIFARGRLRRAPLSLAQLASTDLFGPYARARILLEPFTSAARGDESVAEYFTRRFGAAAYRDMLGPLFGGLYAGDPAQMAVRHALAPALRELGATRSALFALLRHSSSAARAPAVGFRRGMRTLTDALRDRLGERVRLESRIGSIAATANGYALVTMDRSVEVANVVLTVPAAEAARLLAAIAPRSASALGSLRYNHLAIVHLDADPEVRGLGYQVSFGERLDTRGVTFNHALFGRHRLHTAFLGGARNPGLVEADDDRIASIATREFESVMGSRATAINVARASLPAWDRSWTALDDLTLPTGIHLAANYESRVGLPGRIARAAKLAETLARAE